MTRGGLVSAGSHLVWICGHYPGGALDRPSWLEVTRELRKLGWQVTLIAAGPNGRKWPEGVEVLCIEKPPIYLIGQLVFHLRILRFQN